MLFSLTIRVFIIAEFLIILKNPGNFFMINNVSIFSLTRDISVTLAEIETG